MSPDDIRREMLAALMGNETLLNELVLKGGNALDLVHRLGSRASLDLDFSIATDLDDPPAFGATIEAALVEHFSKLGVVVFDFRFGPRPTDRVQGVDWGGWLAELKVITADERDRLNADSGAMRRQSIAIGPGDTRRFRIEISAFEWIDGRQRIALDEGVDVSVYSLEMIVTEKLRAICQQSPNYSRRRHPTPRPRDFFDIVTILDHTEISLSSERIRDLIPPIFSAKEVPLKLLAEIEDRREFHREGWAYVEVGVRESIKDFDYYFDVVLEELGGLQDLWEEDLPSIVE